MRDKPRPQLRQKVRVDRWDLMNVVLLVRRVGGDVVENAVIWDAEAGEEISKRERKARRHGWIRRAVKHDERSADRISLCGRRCGVARSRAVRNNAARGHACGLEPRGQRGDLTDRRVGALAVSEDGDAARVHVVQTY